MKAEKITENLEFDVKYAEGSRKEAMFSIANALIEMVNDFGLIEEFTEYIEKKCQELDIMSDKMPNNCRLIREMGEPGKDGNGKCMGFTRNFTDDEPCEICKKCEWCTAREEGD